MRFSLQLGAAAVMTAVLTGPLWQSHMPPAPAAAGTPQDTAAIVPGEAPRGVRLRWVRIPAGTAQVGCVPADKECFDREKPHHAVTLTKPFEMLATEVTRAEWRQYATATKADMPPAPEFPQNDSHPVVNVAWDAARAFCAWVGGRLPTEAEWEYAARGGQSGLIYPWGNVASHDFANYGKNSCCGGAAAGRDAWEFTAPVGSFAPNGYGLFDMAGNVWEWVADRFDEEYYRTSPTFDPPGPEIGSARVTRGGSWYTYPLYIRSSYRVRNRPSARYDDFGVRCVRDVVP